MDIVQTARRRHTTKAYDRTRKIPQAVVASLRELLRLAPSSVNAQPWHFVVASTEEGKERIAQATEAGFPFNTAKIRDASHVIVLASRAFVDDAHQDAVLAQEERDGRFVNDAAKTAAGRPRRVHGPAPVRPEGRAALVREADLSRAGHPAAGRRQPGSGCDADGRF